MENETPRYPILSLPLVGLDAALAAITAVRREAEEAGVRLGVVVVDARGGVVASACMDGAQFVALELAEAKAVTAAAFGAPSDAWAEATAPGGSDWGMGEVLPGRLTPMAGGAPWFVDGVLVGAIGVSGAPSDVDRGCVERALARLAD